jgi:hypothetical protein
VGRHLALLGHNILIPSKAACSNKMKTKNTTVGTIPKSNIKIVERDKIDTSNTQIHDRSLSWCGTGTLINSGGVNFMYFYMAFVIKFSAEWSIKTFSIHFKGESNKRRGKQREWKSK